MSAPATNRPKTGVFSPGRAQIPQRTLRTDNWLKAPIWTDLGFAAFVIYATVRAFQRDYFFVPQYHYLTPFYSPCLSKACGEASDFWPQILPATGAAVAAAVRVPVAAVPAAVPADLLLLPRRLLPLGVAVPPHRLRRGRAAREIHWRDPLSVDHPEHPPVLLLHRRHHLDHQHLRRDRRLPLRQRPPAASDSGWATSSWSATS